MRLKPFDAFYRMKEMRDGYRNECKACNLARRKAAYAANPEPTIERAQSVAARRTRSVQPRRSAATAPSATTRR